MSEVLFRPDSSPTTRILGQSPQFTLWRLEGPLALSVLEDAVEEMLEAHPALLFGKSPPQRVKLKVADFEHDSDAANSELSPRFTPPQEKGFRFYLQRLGPQHHRLLLVLHTTLANSLIAKELVEELAETYARAALAGPKMERALERILRQGFGVKGIDPQDDLLALGHRHRIDTWDLKDAIRDHLGVETDMGVLSVRPKVTDFARYLERMKARAPSPTRGGLGETPPFRGSLGDRVFSIGDGDDDLEDLDGVLGSRAKPVQPPPPPASDDASDDDASGAASDDASSEGNTQQGFYFRVRGEKVAWRKVQVGSNFELIFDFGKVPAETLVRIVGERLERARLTDEDGLDIALLSSDFEVRDCDWVQPLRFQEGRLAEPICFRLRAPGKVPAENPLPLQLVFSRRGSVFYRFRLTLYVVEQINSGVRPAVRALPPTLDLDAAMHHAVAAGTQREAVLSLSSMRGGLIHADLRIGPRNPRPHVLELGTAALADHIGRMAERVTKIASGRLWRYLTDPFEDVEERFLEKLEEAREQLIGAGSELFASLASDTELGPMLRAMDELPDGSRITILTDRYFIPWELLYPRDFVADWPDAKKAQNPADPRALWGYRFQIETLLFDKADSCLYPIAPSEGKPFVTCYINPTIKPEAVADHKTLAEHLEPGHWHWIDEGQAMRNQLFAEDDPASLLYFLCHGSNSAPFDPKSEEILELDEEHKIMPRFLQGSPPLARQPLVVLNACHVGAISPLAFTSFLSQFLERKAAGLVVPSFPVPVVFGVAFGRRLLEGYLAGETIGETIHRLRRRLIEIGNPLGLFYTLQCKLEMRAPGPIENRIA